MRVADASLPDIAMQPTTAERARWAFRNSNEVRSQNDQARRDSGWHPPVDARYYLDPATDEPHIYSHAVNEREIEDVLVRPIEDRPGREGSRVAMGRRAQVGFCHHGVSTGPQGLACVTPEA